LILPDGPGRAILFQESALETADAGRGLNGKHAGRIRDVAPSLIRAQVLADPVRVARAIVRAKLAASAARAQVIDRSKWSLSLERARSVAEIVTIEARIAASYWRAFRDFGLRERRNGNLPRSWLRFANRNKGARFLGARHASHPINAMLNYAYVVEAGRLARALTAIGLALPIGFLHSDKKGRNSLCDRAASPRDRRPSVQIHLVARVRAIGLPSGRAERTPDRSNDHCGAFAERDFAVGEDRGRGAVDGAHDCGRRKASKLRLDKD
jgi:hypothetical protein